MSQCKRKRERPFRSLKYAKVCAEMLQRMTGERCEVDHAGFGGEYCCYLIRYCGERAMRT